MRSIARAFFVAAFAVSAAASARAQICNCSCDSLLGPCEGIGGIHLNENGQAPASPFFLSAGPGGTASAEVRHANRFQISAGTTLTHVCVALKNPTTSGTTCAGGDPAYIFIAVHDTSSNLPGAMLPPSITNFVIAPCVGTAIRHQLVAFSTPQFFPSNADVWVGVAYPTAQYNIGHQGVRPRTAGASAVWIGGAQSRWFSYDDALLPPFNGQAPIIRALQVVRGNGVVNVSPSSGLVTSENMTTAQFDVVISAAPPLSNVIVDLASSNPAEGIPSPAQLIFTPANYNIPQTVTVTGQDDPVADGPQPYQIITTVTSADPCYQNASCDDVQLTNLDNDGSSSSGCDLLWTPILAPGPSRRSAHAMAYDPARGRVVLFGGRDLGGPLGDTWEFDVASQAWSPIVPVGPAPAPRFGHTLTFSPMVNGVLLIGGHDGSTALADAWSWDGSSWTPLPPHPAGPRAFHAAATFHASGGGVFTAGGANGPLPLPDAWTFAPFAGGWVPEAPMLPPIGPAPRSNAAMCVFPAMGAPLVYGGEDASIGAQFSDSWAYMPGAWLPVPSAGGPGFRADHSMAELLTRDAAVLFGGRSASAAFNSDTWVLDASTVWSLNGATGPSPRNQAAMAAIEDRREVLLFGGNDLSALGFAGDTWVLSDPAYPAVTIAGPGHVQHGTDFTLAASAVGTATYSYQWLHNSAPLVDGGRISGSQTATLTVLNAAQTDAGVYTCVVTSPCGTTPVSLSVQVTVSCPADFNNSGTVTVQDIFDFLAAYFGGDMRADVNNSGTLTVQDIFDFLAIYFAGCP
ncbi:MAG: kelch repeat-containing protein [Phycisphaerales bacterium]